MTNAVKKKMRELLAKPTWTTGDIMDYFGYSKSKASDLIIKLRENIDNIPVAYRGTKRPPIIVDNLLQAIGTTKENELDKVK